MPEFTAVIQLSVSRDTQMKVDGEDADGRKPDSDYVRTELEWASNSFDTFDCAILKGKVYPMKMIFDILEKKEVLPLLIGINEDLDKMIAKKLKG
jgi:hypothetical protein